MIHFDHNFLVEASYDIYSSSKYDLKEEEKHEAIEELREIEIQHVLGKFDLEDITKDQLQIIEETLCKRMNSFLCIGYGIANCRLYDPMEGKDRYMNFRYPENTSHGDHSYLSAFFDRYKLQNVYIGIGRVCESIEDYDNLLTFHNSDERIYTIEKSGFNHPVNRNLYEAEELVKKLIDFKSKSYRIFEDKMKKHLHTIEFLKELEKLSIYDLEFSSTRSKSDLLAVLRDIPRSYKFIEPFDFEMFFILLGNISKQDEARKRFEEMQQWVKNTITSIENNPLQDIRSKIAELDIEANEIKKQIIEYIETSTLKLSYYERFKNQLQEEVNTTEAEAV